MTPALVGISLSVFWLYKWIVEQRHVPTRKAALIGFLGFFSLLAPRIQTPKAHRYFRNFALSVVSFVAYVVLLFAVFGKIASVVP
jgi:hypothetical protein